MITDVWQHYWPMALGSLVPIMLVWVIRRSSDHPRAQFCSVDTFPELSQIPAERQVESAADAVRRFYRSRFSFLPYLVFGLLFCSGRVIYELLRANGSLQTSRWLAGGFGAAGVAVGCSFARVTERALLRRFFDQRLS